MLGQGKTSAQTFLKTYEIPIHKSNVLQLGKYKPTLSIVLKDKCFIVVKWLEIYCSLFVFRIIGRFLLCFIKPAITALEQNIFWQHQDFSRNNPILSKFPGMIFSSY